MKKSTWFGNIDEKIIIWFLLTIIVFCTAIMMPLFYLRVSKAKNTNFKQPISTSATQSPEPIPDHTDYATTSIASHSTSSEPHTKLTSEEYAQLSEYLIKEVYETDPKKALEQLNTLMNADQFA